MIGMVENQIEKHGHAIGFQRDVMWGSCHGCCVQGSIQVYTNMESNGKEHAT